MKKQITIFSILMVLGATGGVALANGTAGWQYGGYNCGNVPPSTSTSRLECRQCCQDAVNNGLLPAIDLLDCNAFCNQAVFNKGIGDPEPGPE